MPRSCAAFESSNRIGEDYVNSQNNNCHSRLFSNYLNLSEDY